MTAKEKAKELVEKYREYAEPIMCDGGFMSRGEGCKRCALIAVDEIIDAIDWHKFEVPNEQYTYWFRVKAEIQKL